MLPWLIITLSSSAAIFQPEMTRAVDVLVTAASVAVDVRQGPASAAQDVEQGPVSTGQRPKVS